jgi:hypothetical protein
MLDNPHAGQRVRVAVEYRDEWPVHAIGDRIGKIQGVGNFITVKFEGMDNTVHVPHRFLEGVE